MYSEKTFIDGELNGYLGSEAGNFGEVHGDYGIGQLNVRLMDKKAYKVMILMNTWFQKNVKT